MAVTNISDLNNLLYGDTSADDAHTRNMLTSNMSGIEAIPYQFLSSVDTRLSGTEIGRKYADKIISRIPLLFLTPCKPVFMEDFNDMDRSTVAGFLLGGDASGDLINGNGRYYSVEYDYDEYYKYLNCMLSAVAAYLGIYEKEIIINGAKSKIGNYSWQNETNSSFKTFFASAENMIFYLDGMTQISESYTNDTTESSIASQINGFADTANEIKFLFGDKGSALGGIIDSANEVTSSITSSLSGVMGKLGGGIIGSLADKGVTTVLNGGKIVFPKIWSNSSTSRSYSIDIKLRSPDHDSLSIFLNILKPYCRLLALTLPRLMDDNPNGYRAPFMVKAYSKGLFNIDYGMITGMNVTKGAECCWNDDGLPTQIDISLDIEDLYSSLIMSGFDDNIKNVVANTSYMDFLANIAGLNIAKMEIGRRIELYYYLCRTDIKQIPSNAFTRMSKSVSNIMGSWYRKLS